MMAGGEEAGGGEEGGEDEGEGGEEGGGEGRGGEEGRWRRRRGGGQEGGRRRGGEEGRGYSPSAAGGNRDACLHALRGLLPESETLLARVRRYKNLFFTCKIRLFGLDCVGNRDKNGVLIFWCVCVCVWKGWRR